MKSGKFYWETQNNQTSNSILGIADTVRICGWKYFWI